MKMYRHGDVQFVPVSEIPFDAVKKDTNVLFYGEVTNHKHVIDVGELFETRDGKLYLRLKKKANVDHDEHKKSEIPAGIYFVGQKRQYNAESGWDRVSD